MDYIHLIYINRITPGLRNCRNNNDKWVFSCPICGDSKKDRRKARAEIYEKDNKTWFYCHNECGGMSFDNFLKRYDEALYDEYVTERYRKKEPEYTPKAPIKLLKEAKNISILDELKSIKALDFFDPVRQYVLSRKIPEKFHSDLYASPKFKQFTNKQLPGKFDKKSLFYDEQRLLIPFFDVNRNVIAFAGRSLAKDAYLRYINIVLDEAKPKIYGLDRWGQNKRTYVLEGPIDSLFLNNAISSAGGNLISVLRSYDRDQFVICFDNEPMSPSTKHKMKNAIDAGFQVCIWPRSIEEKDINKMILSGLTSEKIENIINENTFKGLTALAALASWSKK